MSEGSLYSLMVLQITLKSLFKYSWFGSYQSFLSLGCVASITNLNVRVVSTKIVVFILRVYNI